MVRALHRAGLEVVLDVVYNHTAEGGAGGPLLSLRGLDPAPTTAWSRRPAAATSTGAAAATPSTSTTRRRSAWSSTASATGSTECHVDGFRFDLAATLGRDHGALRPRRRRSSTRSTRTRC